MARWRARLGGEGPADDAQNHIASRDHALGEGTLVHIGDEDLAGIGRHQSIVMDPAAQPRRAEVPLVRRVPRDLRPPPR